MHVPLEDNSGLARKYGIAFAWINSLESQFTNLLIHYGIRKRKKCENMMLGQKLRDADKIPKVLINNEIIKKLRKLNKKRRVLAHNGGVLEVATIEKSRVKRTGLLIITHKGKQYLFGKFLDRTIKLAKETSDELHKLSLAYAEDKKRNNAK